MEMPSGLDSSDSLPKSENLRLGRGDNQRGCGKNWRGPGCADCEICEECCACPRCHSSAFDTRCCCHISHALLGLGIVRCARVLTTRELLRIRRRFILSAEVSRLYFKLQRTRSPKQRQQQQLRQRLVLLLPKPCPAVVITWCDAHNRITESQRKGGACAVCRK